MTRANLGHFEPCTQSMGPGPRACLWVRGCSIRCKNCATPQYWEYDSSGFVEADDLLKRVRAAMTQHNLEGVSFSGGEPFEQARALALIARGARDLGLSTLCWSGHTLDHLQGPNAPEGSDELLSSLDVLIDGAYVHDARTDSLPLRGSTNQTIHFLTSRYAQKDIGPTRFSVEMIDGRVTSHGVTSYQRLNAVMRLLGAT